MTHVQTIALYNPLSKKELMISIIIKIAQILFKRLDCMNYRRTYIWLITFSSLDGSDIYVRRHRSTFSISFSRPIHFNDFSNEIMSIPLVPIGLSAVCTMVLGAYWYSPALFGKRWAHLMGFDLQKMYDDPDLQKRAKRGYIIASICHIIKATVLAFFLQHTNATYSWKAGFNIGFLCWLGFSLPSMLPNHLFSKNQFSWTLAAIDIAYPMVSLSMSGAIISSWQSYFH